MFDYFPNNYVWNLSLNLALAAGGTMGEIDRACRPILSSATEGADVGTEAFFEAWRGLGDELVSLAMTDEGAGRLFSAGEKYGRAAMYYLTAERMVPHDLPSRKHLYAHMLDCFQRYMRLTRQPAERVDIPYKDGVIAGYLHRADPASGPAPCAVFLNGLDSIKEMTYRIGLAQALAKRGVASLFIDQPGTGEALRLYNLTAIIETEQWASVVVDYLETRADIVDRDRIGISGWSMAGYYAPRAAAFEPRFKFCVAFGAQYDFGEVQQKRLALAAQNPVPHYWEHVQWVWGKDSLDSWIEYSKGITLRGILDRIKVPTLVVHGENDRQINVSYAHNTFDDLVNAPKRELKIFREGDGGIEHCGADAIDNARDFIADWIAEVVGARTS
jgi:dienelactone hydrolase